MSHRERHNNAREHIVVNLVELSRSTSAPMHLSTDVQRLPYLENDGDPSNSDRSTLPATRGSVSSLVSRVKVGHRKRPQNLTTLMAEVLGECQHLSYGDTTVDGPQRSGASSCFPPLDSAAAFARLSLTKCIRNSATLSQFPTMTFGAALPPCLLGIIQN